MELPRRLPVQPRRRSCCTTAAPRTRTSARCGELAEQARDHLHGGQRRAAGSCEKAGVEPARDFDLSRLRAIGSTGSPLPPEGFRWVYEHVGADMWLFSTSGGTDVCTAFVGGCPLLPVYEGELQCRALGCAVESWDEQGRALVDEVGELVLTEPMPSMPLFLWGDDVRASGYRESYFEMYPGIWRHGDWIRITPRGGAVIYGRSDSTINRQGVRMGTSEIYRAAGPCAEVPDALVVDVPDAAGVGEELRMVLFVVLQRRGELGRASCVGEIKARIREDCSPRHVPNEILQIARGAEDAVGQGARGAGQADPDGCDPAGGRQRGVAGQPPGRSTTSWSWRAAGGLGCLDGSRSSSRDRSRSVGRRRRTKAPMKRLATAPEKAPGAAPAEHQSLSIYIQTRFEECSRSQKDVAQYIVDHLDEAAFQTAEELARRANTSSSTVVRFSQALGFEGFPELQAAAREEYRRVHAQPPQRAGAEWLDAAVLARPERVRDGARGRPPQRRGDRAQGLRAARSSSSRRRSSSAEKVLVAGTDQMAFFASYLRHLLMLLDLRVDVVASPSQEALSRLGRIDSTTLVIGLSAGRPHPLVVRAMKLARHRKAAHGRDHRRDALGGRQARADQALLLVEQPRLRALAHGAAEPIQALAYGVYAQDTAQYDDRIKAFRLK